MQHGTVVLNLDCVFGMRRAFRFWECKSDGRQPGFAEKDVGNGSAGHLTQEPSGAPGN